MAQHPFSHMIVIQELSDYNVATSCRESHDHTLRPCKLTSHKKKQWGSWQDVKSHSHMRSLLNNQQCLLNDSNPDCWNCHLVFQFAIVSLNNGVFEPNCCGQMRTVCKANSCYQNNMITGTSIVFIVQLYKSCYSLLQWAEPGGLL